MSRTTVRAGVVKWLSGTDGLSKVYASTPKFDPGEAYIPNPGAPSGAVAVVYLGAERENREAYGGWKRVHYDVTLDLYHRSIEGDADDVMASFDALVENVKVRLRADGDHTWGGLFWTAAETSVSDPNGPIDIVVAYGEPILSSGVTLTWAGVGFPIYEQVQVG